MKIVTIGAYGFDSESFRTALQQSQIQVFIDIRRRRGVRGSQYAFANSQRLQNLLQELSIPYVHLPDLAPSHEAIQFEHEIARKANIPQRERADLTREFIADYNDSVLTIVHPASFMAQIPAGTTAFALFCVERIPTACHRSLLANLLKDELGGEITHIVP